MSFKHLFGVLAAGLMFLCLIYPLLKKMKNKLSKLFFHCLLGYISTLLAVIHISEISLSLGFISFIFMLLILATGIAMKHFGKFFKNIRLIRYIHMALAFLCAGILLFHIAEYLILG